MKKTQNVNHEWIALGTFKLTQLFMKDSQFRITFTYRQAVEEFENWKQHLEELTAVATETLSVYRSAGLRESECSATDFKIADWDS